MAAAVLTSVRQWQEHRRKALISPLGVGLNVCQGMWSGRASESGFSEQVIVAGKEGVGGQSGRLMGSQGCGSGRPL